MPAAASISVEVRGGAASAHCGRVLLAPVSLRSFHAMKKHLIKRHEDDASAGGSSPMPADAPSPVHPEAETGALAQVSGRTAPENLAARHEQAAATLNPLGSSPAVGSALEKNPSSLDAFLGKSPTAAQLAISTGAPPPLTIHHVADERKDVAAKRQAAHSAGQSQTLHDGSLAIPAQSQEGRREVSGGSVGGSLNFHAAQQPGVPSVPKVSHEGETLGKSPGLSVDPAAFKGDAPSQRLPDALKEREHGLVSTGPLRGGIGGAGYSSSPRASPKLSPNLAVLDGVKHLKVKPEGKSEGKVPSPSSKKENEELQRARHADAFSDRSEKRDVSSRESSNASIKQPSHIVTSTKSDRKEKGENVGSSKEKSSYPNSKLEGDTSSILVGIGERIKRRSKTYPKAESGADDGDSEEETKEGTKRRRTTQRTSSSEEEDDDDEDGEEGEADRYVGCENLFLHRM